MSKGKGKMMLKRKKFLMMASSVIMLTGTSPVFAGFEWKLPAAPAASPQEAPVMPAQKVQSIEAVSLPAAAAKKKPPMPAAPETISGFGTDLPLTVAMQQIVPPGTKVSFAPGVNPDLSVSWQGEKPWKQVLADMLSAQGLVSSFQGNAVLVAPIADAAPVKAAAVPMGIVPDNGKSDLAAHAAAPVRGAPVPAGIILDGRRNNLAAHAAAPNKADLIPADMIADNGKSAYVAPVAIAPALTAPVPAESVPAPIAAVPSVPMAAKEAPIPVTIRRDRPAAPPENIAQPAQEKTPAQDRTVVPQAAARDTSGYPSVLSPGLFTPSWHATKGQTLRDVLDDWSKTAHVVLYWSIDYDYRLKDTVAYSGSFEEAAEKLFDQFAQARPQPYGRLHRDRGGNEVLVVAMYDNPN